MIGKFLALLFISLAAGAPARAQIFPPPEGEISVTYDRFTDHRKITLYDLMLDEKQTDFDYLRLYITVGVEYRSGLNPEPPRFVVVMFSAWTPFRYHFNEESTLYAIIDGKRRSYGSAGLLNRQVINGKYVSQVGGRLAYGDFQEIIKAKKVEMRIGDVEFTLTEQTHDKLQSFAGMITP